MFFDMDLVIFVPDGIFEFGIDIPARGALGLSSFLICSVPTKCPKSIKAHQSFKDHHDNGTFWNPGSLFFSTRDNRRVNRLPRKHTYRAFPFKTAEWPTAPPSYTARRFEFNIDSTAEAHVVSSFGIPSRGRITMQIN
jgi:hypothetical protein